MDRWTDTNKLFCVLSFRPDNFFFFYQTVQREQRFFFKFLFIELPVGSTAVSFLLTDNLLQVEMVDFSIFLHLVFFLYQSLYQHVPEIKVVRSVFFELIYNCPVSVRDQHVYPWCSLIPVSELDSLHLYVCGISFVSVATYAAALTAVAAYWSRHVF